MFIARIDRVVAHQRNAGGIPGVGEGHDRELALGDRRVVHDEGIGRPGAAVVVDRHGVLHAVGVVPAGVDDVIGPVADVQVGIERRVGLHIRIVEHHEHIVRERGIQAQVAEGDALRVRVVGHRHHLCQARLGALAAVVDAEHPVVAEVEVDAGVRRPVQHAERRVEGVDAAYSLVVRSLRLQAGAQRDVVLLFLLADVEAGVLAVHLVRDVAGVVDVLHVVAAYALVVGVLGRGAVAVVIGVVGLQIEILAQRLRVGDAAVRAGRRRAGAVELVDHRGIGPIDGIVTVVAVADIVVGAGDGLVVAFQVAVAVAVAGIDGERTPRFAQALAPQDAAVGPLTVAVAEGSAGTVVHLADQAVRSAVGREGTPVLEVAPAQVEVGLEEQGCILRDFPVGTGAGADAPGAGAGETIIIRVEGRAVFLEGLAGGFLLDIAFVAVEHRIAHDLGAILPGIAAVEAGHVGAGDAVAAPAAALAALATAETAAAHPAHSGSRHIVEATVVGIVGVADEGELLAFGEVGHHRGRLVTRVVYGARSLQVVAATAHHIAEPAVHHALLDAQVEHRLFFTVVDAGEFGLLGFLLHHADLLDDIGRQVLAGDRRIVEEELLAVDLDLADGLAVGSDGTVGGDLDARKPLEQVFQHVVVGRLDQGHIVFDRVFLDGDRIADVGHRSTFQEIGLDIHLLDAQVRILVDINGFLIVVVAHQDGGHFVLAGRNALDLGGAGAVALGVFEYLGLTVGGDGNGRIAHRLAVALVHQFDLQIVVLGLCIEGPGNEKQHQEDCPAETIFHRFFACNKKVTHLRLRMRGKVKAYAKIFFTFFRHQFPLSPARDALRRRISSCGRNSCRSAGS